MRQEMEIVLTLDVSVNVSKQTVKKALERILNLTWDNLKVKSIEEKIT